MSKRYLIFERGYHPAVYFARGADAADAIRNYVLEQNPQVALEADGALVEGGTRYAHPLAYVEAWYKVDGDWQIRELPDWAWQDRFAEVFCGEGERGLASAMGDCRERFARDFPGVRAKAFLWCLASGTLVSFYRRRGLRVSLLRRYLLNWDQGVLSVSPWDGDHEQILRGLVLVPPRWPGAAMTEAPVSAA